MPFNNKMADLWIAISYIPITKAWSIYNTYGDFLSFWEHFSPEMENLLGAKLFERLYTNHDLSLLENQHSHLINNNIHFIPFGSKDYPNKLRTIPYPPLWLFARGNLQLLQEESNIALVGTRHPSRYGMDTCNQIAKDLASRGICVVSGFAAGIDVAAHQGAVLAGGKTIAVLGTGLDVDYPKSNVFLKSKIEEGNGLFISEYPLGSPPKAHHFPQRNRIISGMSDGMVFVEGQIQSGGMVTVRHALDQGKEVFALPGEVGRIGSEGPHMILREGARLITCAKDIIEDMGWEYLNLADVTKTKRNQTTSYLNEQQQTIVRCLKKEDCSFEQLIAKTKMNVELLGANLTFMEIEGIIKKSPGNIYHYVLG